MISDNNTPRGISRFGLIDSPASEVDDSNPTRIRIAIVD